jgi:hypothetical protein
LLCKKLRDANTNKWWGGEDLKHSSQLHYDLDVRIKKALKNYDKECGKKC